MSTSDDLAHLEKVGISTDTTGWLRTNFQTMHYKYPQSVGADSIADNINFNSHDSSEYAIQRATAIDEATHEPYMLFEFMKIREDKAEAKIAEKTEAIGTSWYDSIGRNAHGSIIAQESTASTTGNLTGGKPEEAVDLDIANSWVDKSIKKVASFFKDLVHNAERDYIGSCALYMPTDIQINDQMVYNEDTRKIGALAEAVADGEAKLGDVLKKSITENEIFYKVFKETLHSMGKA